MVVFSWKPIRLKGLPMARKKAAPDQFELTIPGLYELAKPKSALGAPEKLGYHWGPGRALPVLGQHSAAKHDIYSTYVDRYVATLTKRHVQSRLKMTIVDGFCGGGLYAMGESVIDGSPLRLLTAIDQARAILYQPSLIATLAVRFEGLPNSAAYDSIRTGSR
jgi:hypothetical protein